MANRSSALDIEIRSITLISDTGGQPQDIRLMVEQFRISEALLLPIVYGEVTVLDGVNLIDGFLMKGFDHIQFQFGNPGVSKLVTRSFRIYNITDRRKVSNSSQVYRILFCSEELYLASQYSISKTFKGKLISDMIKDICVNTLKIPQDRLSLESTVGNQDYTLHYARPFEAINKLARKALTQSDHPSFVFYETLLKGFQFRSIESLFKEEPVAEYVYKQTKIDSSMIDPFGIIAYVVKKNFDSLADTQNGKFAANMVTFDIIRQVAETIKFDHEEFFGKTQHLEGKGKSTSKMAQVPNRKGDTANKAIESHARYVPTTLKQPQNTYIKSHQPDIKPQQIEKTDLQRNSFFQNFQDHRIKMTVPGNSTLESGMIINLKVISPEVQPDVAGRDEQILSGKYIITTISHYMTPNHKFYTDLTVVKDDVKAGPGNSPGSTGSKGIGSLIGGLGL